MSDALLHPKATDAVADANFSLMCFVQVRKVQEEINMMMGLPGPCYAPFVARPGPQMGDFLPSGFARHPTAKPIGTKATQRPVRAAACPKQLALADLLCNASCTMFEKCRDPCMLLRR